MPRNGNVPGEKRMHFVISGETRNHDFHKNAAAIFLRFAIWMTLAQAISQVVVLGYCPN